MLSRLKKKQVITDQASVAVWRPEITKIGEGFGYVAELCLIDGDERHQVVDTQDEIIFKTAREAHQAIHNFADRFELAIKDCRGFIDEQFRWWPCGASQPQFLTLELEVVAKEQGFWASLKVDELTGAPAWHQDVLNQAGGLVFASGETAHRTGYQVAQDKGAQTINSSGYLDHTGRRRNCQHEVLGLVACQIEVISGDDGFYARAKSEDGRLVDVDLPGCFNRPPYKSGQGAHEAIHAFLKNWGLEVASCSGYETDSGWQACDLGLPTKPDLALVASTPSL